VAFRITVAQLLPQAPQLLTSLPVLRQMPLQQTWPPGQSEPRFPQVQCPLTQLSPAGQTWPQAPQLFASVVRWVSQPLAALPSQSAYPAWQA
jgi:hypothetical protein